MAKRWKDVELGGVLAKQLDGADAVFVEVVVDILREVFADGCGREVDARGPLVDEVFDVSEAVVAGLVEVGGDLGGGLVLKMGREDFVPDGPDGGYPG